FLEDRGRLGVKFAKGAQVFGRGCVLDKSAGGRIEAMSGVKRTTSLAVKNCVLRHSKIGRRKVAMGQSCRNIGAGNLRMSAVPQKADMPLLPAGSSSRMPPWRPRGSRRSRA